MSKPIYTIEPKRVIALDGKPLIKIRVVHVKDKWDVNTPSMPPLETDALCNRIVALLNWEPPR